MEWHILAYFRPIVYTSVEHGLAWRALLRYNEHYRLVVFGIYSIGIPNMASIACCHTIVISVLHRNHYNPYYGSILGSTALQGGMGNAGWDHTTDPCCALPWCLSLRNCLGWYKLFFFQFNQKKTFFYLQCSVSVPPRRCDLEVMFCSWPWLPSLNTFTSSSS